MEDMLKYSKEASVLLKALSNHNRLMIVCHLIDRELCVTDLNAKLPVSQSSLSQHLAVLRKDGVVSTRRESQTIYYSIADTRTIELIKMISRFYSPEANKH